MMRRMSLMAAPSSTTCGDTKPYPAPTGSQVAPGDVTISNMRFEYDGVTYYPGNTGTPIPLESVWDSMQLQLNWSIEGNPQPGDYFVFNGPIIAGTESNPVRAFYSVNQWFPVTAPGDTSQIIACASVVNGVATLVFTDYVSTHDEISGDFFIGVRMAKTDSTTEETVNITLNDGTTITIDVPANPGPGEPNQDYWKSGWFTYDDQGVVNPTAALTWQIKLPAYPDGLKNVSITDSSANQPNWDFSCDAWPSWQQNWYSYETNPPGITIPNIEATCDPATDTVTFNIPLIPGNTEVRLYFYGNVNAYENGTLMGGPFNNTTTGSATGITLRQMQTSVEQQFGGGSGSGDSRPGQLEITKTPSVTRVTEVGQQITYTFTVSNTGPVRVNNIKVVDQQLTDLDLTIECQTNTLAPGEETTCTSTAYSVTQADIDARNPILNVAYATGENPATTPVPTPSATSTVEVVVTPSPTPTQVAPPTQTPTPTASETPSPTATMTATVTPSPTSTAPASTATPSPTSTTLPPTSTTVPPTTQPTQSSVTGLPSTGVAASSGSEAIYLLLAGAAGLALLAAGIYRRKNV